MKIKFNNKCSSNIYFEINSDNFIDDEEIFISIDGKIDNELSIEKIKKMYIEYGEKIVNRINGFFLFIYMISKKIFCY